MKFLLKIFFYLICMFMVLYYIIQHSYIIDTWITGYAIPENDGWGVLFLSTIVTLMSLRLKEIYHKRPWLYPFVISMIPLLFFTQLTHAVINIAYKNSSGFFFTSFCNIIALMSYWGGKVITSIILNWLNPNNNKIT